MDPIVTFIKVPVVALSMIALESLVEATCASARLCMMMDAVTMTEPPEMERSMSSTATR